MSDAVNQGLKETYSEATFNSWTSMDKLAYAQVLLMMLVVFSMVLSSVLSFVGLYAGSLRKRSVKA